MNAKKIAGWLLAIAASAVFAYAAFLKLTSNRLEIDGFNSFALPLWFMYAVGVAEVVGVILLLFTKQRPAGAAILAIVGLGAAFEHATHGQLSMAPIPLVLAIFAVAAAFLLGDGPRKPA